jgi:EmrB/QacA subfamily drug resistance transporter
MTEPAPAGYELTHRQVLSVLSGLMLGMFLAALDQTIVATAIRTIGDDLHGLSVQAWVTTAYLITSTISTPLYGKLSDIYGRKPFFLAAISIFVVGSAACAFSTSMYMLAGFRALQGLGAGGLFSLALAIIGDIVPPRERARYQGYFLAVFGTSSVLGPVIGGFFAGADTILGITGWRWVFLVNVPIGIVALVVVARVLNIPHTRRDHRLDILGALSLTVGLVPLLTVAEQGRSWGWGSQRSILCYVVGGLGLLAFLWFEHRAGEEALLPLRMFRNSTFSLTAAVGTVVGVGMFGSLVVLPLYLQIVRDASPTRSGLLLLPLTAGIMVASVISGQLISRTGRYKIFPVVGSLLMAAGLVLLHSVGVDTPFWRTSLFMVVVGLGLGSIMQPITLAVQNAMPPQDIGVATSSATFFRQMGGTLGVAVFLSVLFSTVAGNIRDAFQDASRTTAFQQAINNPDLQQNPANAPVLRALHGGGAVSNSALNDTSFIQRLDPALARPFKQGFSTSMDLVFLIAAAVLVLAFVLLLFLPELPLRTRAAISAREPSSPLGEQPGLDPVGPAGGADRAEATTARGDGRAGLSNAAVLGGRVRGPRGDPVPKATLTVTTLQGDQVARTVSDAAGGYRLTLPTGGTYLLICASPEYQPLASTVTVATGEVHRDLNLTGASRLRGRTVRQTNEPVAGATVTVTDARGEVVAVAVSDDSGEFELADLYPGDYTVVATAPSSRPVARSVAVDVTGGQRLDLVLPAAGALSGTIRAASSGRPVPEASVTLVDGSGNVLAATVTADDGGYAFADLLPGPYTLTASGYAPVATRVDVGDGTDDRRDVELGAAVDGRTDGAVPAGRATGTE